MASSSQASASRTGSRFWLWGLGLLVVLAALYSAGWYYATSVLKDQVLVALGKQERAGMTGECADMSLSGFPFSIGLSCSSVKIDDHDRGVSASFDRLSSHARVFAPGDITWSLQSPAEFRSAQGISVSAEWASLQSQLIARGQGIEQGMAVIEGLKAAIVSSLDGRSINVKAARTEIHTRQAGADLQATIGIDNATVTVPALPQPLPAVSADADVVLTGKAALLAGEDQSGEGLRGTAGIVNHAVADIGEGRTLALTGPFSFDDQGYLSGQFKLKIDQLGPWRESLKTAIPAAARTIDFAGKLLRSLAGGGDSVSVDLTVNHGAVSLSGFIPLGNLPPI